MRHSAAFRRCGRPDRLDMCATCRCLIRGWTATPGTDSPSPAGQQVSAGCWARGGLRSRPKLCDDYNDVPQLLSGFGVPVSLDHLLKREAPVDDRAQPSRFDQASQVGVEGEQEAGRVRGIEWSEGG